MIELFFYIEIYLFFFFVYSYYIDIILENIDYLFIKIFTKYLIISENYKKFFHRIEKDKRYILKVLLQIIKFFIILFIFIYFFIYINKEENFFEPFIRTGILGFIAALITIYFKHLDIEKDYKDKIFQLNIISSKSLDIEDIIKIKLIMNKIYFMDEYFISSEYKNLYVKILSFFKTNDLETLNRLKKNADMIKNTNNMFFKINKKEFYKFKNIINKTNLIDSIDFLFLENDYFDDDRKFIDINKLSNFKELFFKYISYLLENQSKSDLDKVDFLNVKDFFDIVEIKIKHIEINLLLDNFINKIFKKNFKDESLYIPKNKVKLISKQLKKGNYFLSFYSNKLIIFKTYSNRVNIYFSINQLENKLDFKNLSKFTKEIYSIEDVDLIFKYHKSLDLLSNLFNNSNKIYEEYNLKDIKYSCIFDMCDFYEFFYYVKLKKEREPNFKIEEYF